MLNEPLKVIYDCDNTTGIIGKDIDDGLTLLYLSKLLEVELLGNTLTFGNGTVAEVEQQSRKMKSLFNLSIDQYPGCEKNAPFDSSRPSPAATFLVNQVKQYPKQITILATGSMNNLYEASLIDPDFFRMIKQIVIMGGKFAPLSINGQPVDELNLSISHIAATAVLNSGCKITLVSGQYIRDAVLPRKQIESKLCPSSSESSHWLDQILEAWFRTNQKWWNLDGMINWDGVTAEAMLDPKQFIHKDIFVEASTEHLKQGLIDQKNIPGNKISVIYQIKNMNKLNDKLISVLNLYR